MPEISTADDGWLVTLEAHFQREHERWKVCHGNDDYEGSMRAHGAVNRVVDRMIGARARGIEGMRVKLRTWIEWYGDGTGFSWDANALIASLAADLGLHDEAARGVKTQ